MELAIDCLLSLLYYCVLAPWAYVMKISRRSWVAFYYSLHCAHRLWIGLETINEAFLHKSGKGTSSLSGWMQEDFMFGFFFLPLLWQSIIGLVFLIKTKRKMRESIHLGMLLWIVPDVIVVLSLVVFGRS